MTQTTEQKTVAHHFACPSCIFTCRPGAEWTRELCGCRCDVRLVRVEGSYDAIVGSCFPRRSQPARELCGQPTERKKTNTREMEAEVARHEAEWQRDRCQMPETGGGA